MAQDNPAPIHILHVVPTLGVGGMELAMSRVISSLPSSEMHHSIVCLKGDAVIGNLFDRDITIYCMHSGSNDISLPWRLWRLIRRIGPTVIHARNWSAWPDVAMARLAMLPRMPLIFSFHGLDTAEVMPFRRRLACRMLTGVTTRIFTVSEASRRTLVEQVGMPAQRIDVIPNGVDTNRFAPNLPRDKGKRLVIGTVGSLTPVKNQALLVRTFARLIAAGHDVELRLAGRGPKKDELTRLARELDVEDRVIFAGHVDDVPGFLHQLDIFALPSSSEQHPNALLEAMACGLPCVATDVGGVGELLGQGRFGQIVEPEDLYAFASALAELCKAPSLRHRFGKMSRKRVCDHYSLQQMVLQYRRLYYSVTERSADRRDAVEAEKGKTDKPRVVMLGPLPPLTGGMATVVNNLRAGALASRCRLTVLNNGKTTHEGRSVLVGIASQIRLFRQLTVAILRQRAQIVHIHTCSGFAFWRDCMHAMIARLLGSRIVWHVHGGGFDVFAAQQARIGKAIMRFALTHASVVIALSEDWVGRLRPFAPRAKWRVVPNGVPITTGKVENRGRKPIFLFLGNLSERKGIHDLVRATVIASRKGFEGQIHLAGKETEPGQRETLEKIIAETDCQSQVRLIGVVSGEAKDEALESADCMVLPSYTEGLPMAILEAMACRLPIISTKVGAIPEVITDGVEGFLIEPGNIEALADCIVRLGKDSQLRQRMGDAARVRVQQRYSLRAMVERILEVYRGVLQKTLT